MPIDNRYARTGVFLSTKIITQSNSFQKSNLNFIVQNIAFMCNEMRINFFLILFFFWALLKINVDISWSVITKVIKVPLRSTCFSCKHVFTKYLIELFLILEQDPGPKKEKPFDNGTLMV